MRKNHKNLLELYTEELESGDIKLREIPVSVFLLAAGDIISFTYRDRFNTVTHRLCLLVTTKKTRNSRRISSNGNKLLYTFDLTYLSYLDLGLAIEVCYKKRRRCSYTNVPIALKSFLGSDNFRSFNIGSMWDLNRLEIQK